MYHQQHTLTLFYRSATFSSLGLSGDILDDGTTPLLDAANKKLADPSIDCASMGVGAIASYDEAVPGAEGEEAVETTKFYPHFDSSTCLSDGLQPSWLQASEIYDTVEDCCRNSFIWNTNCVAQSTPIEGVVFYPASGTYACLSDGKQPPYMSDSDLFSNKEDCCEYHFSWVLSDCLSGEATTTTTSTTTTTTTKSTTTTTKSTDNPGTSATTTAKATAAAGQVESSKATTTTATTTTKATAYEYVPDGQSPMFFPVFDSGLTTCRNDFDRTPASWLSVKDFKSTVSDCCRSYASNYDDCVSASYAAVRYFPDFRTMSCVSEEAGMPEDWISGDYFRWSEKRCCKAFFASAESSSCKDLL